MKTKRIFIKLLSIFFMLLVSMNSHAKIWRVNSASNYNPPQFYGENFGGNQSFPVFKQIADGNTSYSDNDTIHVEGSTVPYNTANISKKLVIIGPGYFLTSNPKTSNNALDAKITSLYFNNGSDSSQVIGMNFVGIGSSGYIFINANQITVKRCRIENKIELASGITDPIIVQCFFPETANQNVFANVGGNYNAPTGIIFNNNICKKTLVWRSIGGIPYPIAECNNNIFDGADSLATSSLEFVTSDFKNNILMAKEAIVNISSSPGIIQYNIGTLNSQFGITNNNIVINQSLIQNLFVGGLSADGYYRLSATSAASGAGFNGTDIGAFGGQVTRNRYTLSGLTPIPVIYDAQTTGIASPSQGLPITIKARTIK